LEILPGALSWLAIILLFVLSAINPVLGAGFMLLILMSMVVKAIGIMVQTIWGHHDMLRAQRVDWHKRLAELEQPTESWARLKGERSTGFGWKAHLANLQRMATSKAIYPRPSEVLNVVIVATYNESIEVLAPTMETVRNTSYDNKNIIMVLAYEERGGAETEETAKALKERYDGVFKEFWLVKHPDGLAREVVGKGPNITYAGKVVAENLKDRGIGFDKVIVTTLDSDNHPSEKYFDYVTYEYIVHEDRKKCSFQPIAMFTNNIWDVPAPMRVIAVGNSFWNVISSMRPHSLRNFASHSQPLDALYEMGFWSKRTIVEDGHQYWRSLFYFKGDYRVVPIHVSIGQDAVLSSGLWKTLKAQFVQLRRWDYGASDVAYVGSRLFGTKSQRRMGWWQLFPKFVRLLDGHVTLAIVAPIVTFGGWVPLLMAGWMHPFSQDMTAYYLPNVVSKIQLAASVGLFVTILLSLKMLPKRPKKYSGWKHIMMVAQWLLMPVCSIVYSAAAAFYSQTRLMLGMYMEKFDVTDKVVKQ
jgi:hypothetical protein